MEANAGRPPERRQAVRRGVFKSVKDLNGKLRAYIEGWNKRAPNPSGRRPQATSS